MPTKHGLRLKDEDNALELICGQVSRLLELGGQNGQGQFLNPAGADRVLELALQNGQLLTENQDF